jgi:hypothetical protein
MRKRVPPCIEVCLAIVDASVDHFDDFRLQQTIVQFADPQCVCELCHVQLPLRMESEEFLEFDFLPVSKSPRCSCRYESAIPFFPERRAELRSEQSVVNRIHIERAEAAGGI